MKNEDDILKMFGNTIISEFIKSVFKSSERINFKSFLDFSHNQNIMISSDYGGEDQSSDYSVYTVTFSSYKSADDWLKQTKHKFSELGYEGEPQYKDIKPKQENGKFIDFIKMANEHFKGITVSLAIDKTINSVFGKDIHENYEHVKSIAGIQNYHLSEKNTEKALRVATLISIFLFLIKGKKSKYYWLSDKDAIAKITDNQNIFEQSAILICNMLGNMSDPEKIGEFGYSLPDSSDSSLQSYYFLTLNDLFAGCFADLLTAKKTKNKTNAIIYHSNKIPKFFYKIMKKNEKYIAERIEYKITYK